MLRKRHFGGTLSKLNFCFNQESSNLRTLEPSTLEKPWKKPMGFSLFLLSGGWHSLAGLCLFVSRSPRVGPRPPGLTPRPQKSTPKPPKSTPKAPQIDSQASKIRHRLARRHKSRNHFSRIPSACRSPHLQARNCSHVPPEPTA